MNIGCFGCSYTNLSVGKITEQYPHILRDVIPSANVYNFGIEAASNLQIATIVENIIQKIKLDFIIVQITHPLRFFNYTSQHKIDYSQYISKLKKRYNVFDKELLISDHNFDLITPSSSEDVYIKFLYGKMNKFVLQEIDNSSIIRMQKQIQHIPHYIYSHHGDDDLQLPNVKNTVGFKHEYLKDEGAHFNVQGNTAIVEKMLLPEITKYVQI